MLGPTLRDLLKAAYGPAYRRSAARSLRVSERMVTYWTSGEARIPRWRLERVLDALMRGDGRIEEQRQRAYARADRIAAERKAARGAALTQVRLVLRGTVEMTDARISTR